ncbi:hypothetical protein [Streptomyces sp. NPDC057909]|uniref:hypothetical protein n=1 Tax=Streptomyces sp. NPDC057909 TaxID=3346277 RepID=UPI0036E7EDF8
MKSPATEATAAGKAWKVAVPVGTSEVFRCVDGSRDGLWGSAYFAFRIPQDQVGWYFAQMGVEVVPGYDVRAEFSDFATKSGHDVSAAKEYEAGSVSNGGITHTVLADEDLGDVATVYVWAVSSG